MSRVPWDQRLARRLVRPLASTPVHPNHLTALALCLGFGAAWLFSLGGAAAHWGAALFMVATFLDHADGELARLAGKTSRFGHYFDHAAALTAYVALFVGIGWGLGNEYGWAPEAGLVAGVSVAGIFGVRLWLEVRFGRGIVRQDNVGGFEPEDVLYVVGPVTWLGLLAEFLLLAAVGAPIFLVIVIWAGARGRSATSGSGP